MTNIRNMNDVIWLGLTCAIQYALMNIIEQSARKRALWSAIFVMWLVSQWKGVLDTNFFFYCTENLQKRTEIEFTSFCRLAHRAVRTSHVQIVSRVDPIERRTGILLARYSASKINLLKFLERNLENLVNKKGRKGAGKVLN